MRNNGADNKSITTNGAYTFATPVVSGGAYNVTVFQQPSNPTQTCTPASITGTVTSAAITNANFTCTTNSYTISGTVSNLATGGSVTLRKTVNGVNEDKVVSANGAFTAFASAVTSGATYTVTVLTNPTVPAGTPAGQTCTVTGGGSGTIGGANVTNVTVNCGNNDTTAPTFTVGSEYPRDTTVGADVHGTITATFSETLNTNTVSVSSFKVTGPSGDVSGAGSSVTVTGGNKVVFTPPTAGLAFNTDYTVTLTTAIKDVAGNSFAGKTWTFNTGRKIAAGGYHACIRYDDGAVKCWGSNDKGQLGLGNTSPRGVLPNQMGTNLPVVKLGPDGEGWKAIELTAGEAFTCARIVNPALTQKVKCWGFNDNGELGLGNTANTNVGNTSVNDVALMNGIDLGSGTVVEIESGAAHSCARFADGSIKCWGLNTEGQLGVGDTVSRGDSGAVGHEITAVSLGTNLKAVKLVAYGGYLSCAILQNTSTSVKSLKCWGENTWGQLGQGDTNSRGNEADEMGDNLQAIPLGAEPLQAFAASGHACAVLANGTLKCWGNNGWGQLAVAGGNDAPANPAVCEQVAPLKTDSCIGDAPNEVAAHVIDVGTGRTIKQIAGGDRQTCALLDNNDVKCWGFNAYGQLGRDDTNDFGDNNGENVNTMPAIDLGAPASIDARSTLVLGTPVELTGGGFFECVHFSSDLVKCWGHNGNQNGVSGQGGQLGQDAPATDNYGDQTGEMALLGSMNLDR